MPRWAFFFQGVPMTHAERLLALAEKGKPNSPASQALRKAAARIGGKKSEVRPANFRLPARLK